MKVPLSISFASILIVSSILFSCSQVEEAGEKPKNKAEKQVDKLNTSFFNIIEKEDYKKLIVVNPLNLDQVEQYTLGTKKNSSISEEGVFYIPTTVDRVACISTSHIGFLDALGLGDKIKGCLNPELIYSSKLHQNYLDDQIVSIGGAVLNIERLVDLDVDLVFASVYDAGGMKYVDQMRNLGLNVVLVSEFLEKDPLKKAEWIKFFAAFFGGEVEKRADSIYDHMKQGYLYTASLVEEIGEKPEVLTGLPWSGTWYVPGGNSFQANFMKDAGAEYIFSNNDEVNSIVVDFEVMLQKGLQVPFWLNVSDAESLNEIASLDSRFSYFRAFREGRIFNNNARKNDSGGNDYWESGTVRPDIVLKDLVKIFHPQLLPEHQLFYYQKIE